MKRASQYNTIQHCTYFDRHIDYNRLIIAALLCTRLKSQTSTKQNATISQNT